MPAWFWEDSFALVVVRRDRGKPSIDHCRVHPHTARLEQSSAQSSTASAPDAQHSWHAGELRGDLRELRPRARSDINGVVVTIYTLDVTATSGAAYGTPEFVVRTARGVRVTA